MKRYIHSCFLLAFLGIWLATSSMAVAQTADVPASGTVSAVNESELKSLITTLENDAERKKLISQLEVLLAAKSKTALEKTAPVGIGARAIGFLFWQDESAER